MNKDNLPSKQPKVASVSSNKTKRTVIVRVNNLTTAIVMIILLALSFYGGTLYGRSSNSTFASAVSRAQHKFAIGLVLYISKGAITITNANTNKTQSFQITSQTKVSINGSRSSPANIKPGQRVLIRIVRNNHKQAGVIIINSSFTD